MPNKFNNQFLDDMESKEHSVFLYCFVMGCGQAETAKRLGKSIGWVNKYHQRIKKHREQFKLKKCLRDILMS